MNKFKNIISNIVILILAISVLVLIWKNKPELAIALGGILIKIFVPFFTKELELEKHRQQLLFEKNMIHMRNISISLMTIITFL